jgi:hypothetical protein
MLVHDGIVGAFKASVHVVPSLLVSISPLDSPEMNSEPWNTMQLAPTVVESLETPTVNVVPELEVLRYLSALADPGVPARTMVPDPELAADCGVRPSSVGIVRFSEAVAENWTMRAPSAFPLPFFPKTYQLSPDSS